MTIYEEKYIPEICFLFSTLKKPRKKHLIKVNLFPQKRWYLLDSAVSASLVFDYTKNRVLFQSYGLKCFDPEITYIWGMGGGRSALVNWKIELGSFNLI